ncbi:MULTISPECIES: helix-turn-helix domain-containing protein [unclassified Streptomyces]|uniref:AraC-like ligand-binding domain-containing protein n=1 Tax=unclassified Streptomyces TaxID=2593676 RepID=UPI0007C5A949|nr:MULTISPECIES: helix-turn-helix domain-containing protein [unclassified Streptomyces]
MAVVLSTSSVPPGERLAYWQAAVWQTFVPSDVTTSKDGPFSGAVASDRLGCLRITTVDSDRQLVRRNRRLIARDQDEYLLVGLQRRGTGAVVQDGRTAPLEPGTFALYDTTRPYTLEFPDRFQLLVFQIPRSAFELPGLDLGRITGVSMGADEGLSAMMVPVLSTLAAEAGAHRSEIGEMLARNAVDLLTTVIAERLGRDAAGTDASHRTLLLRIRAFAESHLGDPELSPEAIAAAHHISVRHLQRLFQAEGTTVGGWIRRRRLEECRRELDRPRRSRPAVAAVAHRWGFVSPAHFSRAFRAAYGLSPREWQKLADGRDAGAVSLRLPDRAAEETIS